MTAKTQQMRSRDKNAKQQADEDCICLERQFIKVSDRLNTCFGESQFFFSFISICIVQIDKTV